MPAGSTYSTIATTTLGSSQSTVTFSSITGIYTDLVAVVSFAQSSGQASMYMNFNGDTGSNYSVTTMEGNGTTTISQQPANRSAMYVVGYFSASYTSPYISIINIMNYSNTTTNKTVVSRSSSNTANAYVGLWRSTSAINSIVFTADSSTFSSGSTFTLYGILSA